MEMKWNGKKPRGNASFYLFIYFFPFVALGNCTVVLTKLSTILFGRWIKFEEDVEEGGNRWSKPHVATLSLHSLFELRSLLLNGTVMLDMEANSLEQIADLVLDNMINKGALSNESREKVRRKVSLEIFLFFRVNEMHTNCVWRTKLDIIFPFSFPFSVR